MTSGAAWNYYKSAQARELTLMAKAGRTAVAAMSVGSFDRVASAGSLTREATLDAYAARLEKAMAGLEWKDMVEQG
jgi:hypothetical protein